MNDRLQNRLIGPYSRMFSTNSGAIRSQTCENLYSISRLLGTVPILGQPPSLRKLLPKQLF